MSFIRGSQIATDPNGIATANINANAVTSAKVDATVFISSGANALTGDANAGGHKITNLGAPTLGTDAARLQDIQAASAGISWKPPALVLSNTNLVLTGEQTIDGVLTSASRVLLTGQTSAIQNGLWVTAAGAWSRPADFATGGHAAGNAVIIEEGTVFKDQGWICSTDPPNDVIDTNNLTFLKAFITPGVPHPVTQNKNMAALATVADGNLATATTVALANAQGGYFGVSVNGVGYIVGDGTKIAVDTYISGDGGTTARTMAAIVAGDTVRWNGSIAGFELSATDRIDFLYQAF